MGLPGSSLLDIAPWNITEKYKHIKPKKEIICHIYNICNFENSKYKNLCCLLTLFLNTHKPQMKICCSSCHMVVVIMHVHSLLFHVLPIISNTDAYLCPDEKKLSIITSLGFSHFPAYSQFRLLTTCPKNLDCPILMQVTTSLCELTSFTTSYLCSQHSSIKPHPCRIYIMSHGLWN